MVSIPTNFCKIMWREVAKHFKAHLIFNAYSSVEFFHIQKAPEQSCLGNTVPDAYYKNLAEVQ
jgi:hypothetical protein